jgi:hypothetical protein
MHCQAIVFGDHPERLMDSLVATSGQMPADVSVPLERADADRRSGWHTINQDHRQLVDPSAYGYGSWVHCVWPTAFLRDHLGPYALLSDVALSALEVPRHHVHKKDGQWWVHVPRFFRTVGVRWSTVYGSSRWQGHSDDDAANGATVSSLDLEYNLATHDPNLIVGPTGPVFHQDPGTEGHNVAQRRLEATLPLMELPPGTPVTLVGWHDKDEQRYGWYGLPIGNGQCTCFDSGYDRPYRAFHTSTTEPML